MIKKYKVTAVISVLNEEKTVKQVVETTLSSSLIDEVIVVNDGSTDRTSDELEQFHTNSKFKYIEFNVNKGKSYAMVTGVEAATGDIVFFVDADILGFTEKHIEQMLIPLINNEGDMIIGHPTENKYDKMLNPLQMLAGERVVYKTDILPLLDNIRDTQYGIETMLNLYYKSKNKKIKFEYLWGVYHLTKLRKGGVKGSIKNYASETKQIVKTLVANYLLVFMVAKTIFKY